MNRRHDGPNGKLHTIGHTRTFLNRARRQRRQSLGSLYIQVEAARVAFYGLSKFDRHQYNVLTGRVPCRTTVGGQWPTKARQLAQEIIQARQARETFMAMRRRKRSTASA